METGEISVSLREREVRPPRPLGPSVCSLSLIVAYSATDTLERRLKRHQSSCVAHSFSSFGSYLLYLLLTLRFQRFNDTIVSENDTETDTLSHLIGCPDEVEAAVF